MEESFGSRLKHAWNAFFNRDPTNNYRYNYSYRPDRKKYSNGKERTIIASIYNRLALDAASIDIFHVKTDDEGRYNEIINSGFRGSENNSSIWKVELFQLVFVLMSIKRVSLIK